jgi:tetratricopeptide (TPR) repeat protein
VLARRYREAIGAIKDARALAAPSIGFINGWLAYAYYMSGDLESALPTCQDEPYWNKYICLAMINNKLGQHAAARNALATLRATEGDVAAAFYASIYAEWGEHESALDWLETAMRLHSADLVYLKTLESYDPLRREPRFQAVMRELKFP